MIAVRLVFINLFLSTLLFAQYSQEWEVPQDPYERGILYFDVNHDSTPEVTKFWWNTVTLYNGANNFEVLWSVVDDTYDNLILWDLYNLNDDLVEDAVFIRSNTLDTITTALMMMPVLSQNVTWTSPEYDGTVSFLDAEDMDDNGTVEIVFGVYRYDNVDSSYYSTLHVLNGQDGTAIWSSLEMQGYMVGPYLGDLDNDGTVEIMFNLYDYKNENYTLQVYSYSGTTNSIVNPIMDLPGDFTIGPNYPNPFNPSTTIPVSLPRRMRVDITVLNVNGKEVANILQGELAPGRYKFSWIGQDHLGRTLPSGIYYYRITTDRGTKVRPMVLLK
jgi:hypothetical protein